MPETTNGSSRHEDMQKAEDDFRALNAAYKKLASQPSESAQWVVQETTIREALTTAAQNLLEARIAVQATNDEAHAERRVEAATAMAEAEEVLVTLVATADEQMSALIETLERIIDTSKARYAAHHVLRGRAARRLLARDTLDGWLRWSFRNLDLPDLRPRPHERLLSLADRLGVADCTRTDEASDAARPDRKD